MPRRGRPQVKEGGVPGARSHSASAGSASSSQSAPWRRWTLQNQETEAECGVDVDARAKEQDKLVNKPVIEDAEPGQQDTGAEEQVRDQGRVGVTVPGERDERGTRLSPERDKETS